MSTKRPTTHMTGLLRADRPTWHRPTDLLRTDRPTAHRPAYRAPTDLLCADRPTACAHLLVLRNSVIAKRQEGRA